MTGALHWESSAVSEQLSRRQRLAEDASKHWLRFLRVVQELAAEDPSFALLVGSACNHDLNDMVIPDLVRAIRGNGGSWASVGEALGVTKSAAFQKWRHLEAEDTPA